MSSSPDDSFGSAESNNHELVRKLAALARKYREEVFEIWESEFGTGRNEGPARAAVKRDLAEIDALEKEALGE